jgi:hypothetical protein
LTKLDISGFGQVVLGSSCAPFKLKAAGVRPKHALLRAVRFNGCVYAAIRPLQGRVFVERRRVSQEVKGEFHLVDGDIVVLGEARLTYRRPETPYSGQARSRRQLPWAN